MHIREVKSIVDFRFSFPVPPMPVVKAVTDGVGLVCQFYLFHPSGGYRLSLLGGFDAQFSLVVSFVLVL